MYSTVQGWVTEQSLSLVNYFDIQYLGMCLLFLHIKKREDLELDLKEKILMIVFAPVMQMTSLASFIYYYYSSVKLKGRPTSWLAKNFTKNATFFFCFLSQYCDEFSFHTYTQ